MSAKKQMGMTISTTVQQQRQPRLLSLKFLRIMAPHVRDADLRDVNSMVCWLLSTLSTLRGHQPVPPPPRSRERIWSEDTIRHFRTGAGSSPVDTTSPNLHQRYNTYTSRTPNLHNCSVRGALERDRDDSDAPARGEWRVRG